MAYKVLLGLYICSMAKEWFDTWFDTNYYHILYKNRNDEEAQLFITNICNNLQLGAGAKVLDLACGKGRHSVMLNKLGLDVIGADLSENSITHAKQFENEHLHFYVHDMRYILRTNYFDTVFNCFTSFGYFKKRHHNQLVANAMVAAVVNGGRIVIDFINSYKGEIGLQTNNSHTTKDGDITFTIHKKLENGFFVKQIDVQDGDNPVQSFTESVQALYLADFKELLSNAGAQLVGHYGDYTLQNFDQATSPRLIMVFEKQ
jgi:cyclopropane fatty-acyl-phospholipid synthase-like methyltransferase